MHVSAVLILSQIIGTAASTLARYASPTGSGVADVFPNITFGESYSVFGNWLYWIGLVCQIIIALGYMFWFRKEQVAF